MGDPHLRGGSAQVTGPSQGKWAGAKREMPRRGVQVAILAFAAAPVLIGSDAYAEVKDFQIRRMLMLKTECQVTGLEDQAGPEGAHRFLAACENVGFYPDGVEILCPPSHDEMDCQIVTKKTEFRHLRPLDR